MNFETESSSRGQAAPGREGRAAGWVKGLALLLAGILLGMGGWRVWGDIQEGKRFRLARQKAEQLLRDAGPQTESRLAALTPQLESLENEVIQTSLATSPAAIDVSRLRLQQRRLGMRLDEADRVLRSLASFVELAPQKLALRPDREVLSAEQQQELADLVAQLDRCRQDFEMLGSDIELAKGRRLQLAAIEAESNRRAQTEAEAVQRAQAEALRVQAEAIERAQTEATQRASLETVRQAQSDLAQLAYLRTLQPAAEPSAMRGLHVQPLVCYANPPLVIGSSYPDRFIGYREFWRHHYGPWRHGYWSGYSPYRCWL